MSLLNFMDFLFTLHFHPLSKPVPLLPRTPQVNPVSDSCVRILFGRHRQFIIQSFRTGLDLLRALFGTSFLFAAAEAALRFHSFMLRWMVEDHSAGGGRIALFIMYSI